MFILKQLDYSLSISMLEIDLGFALNCYRALEISSTLSNC